MRTYYDHVHAYHVSYAAYDHGNADPANDYVRARRYLPESGQGLEGTALRPAWDHTGLFAPGVPHRITVLKVGQDLLFHAVGGGRPLLCTWHNDGLPAVEAGRVGLRHMYTRGARYRDIRISTRP